MAIDRTGISSLQTGAPDIKYTGDEGPRSPDQQLMASADPMLVEEYQKYVFQMEEQGLQPISFREFVEQVMAESRMAEGGRAGYRGGQLVKPLGISDEEWEIILGSRGPRPLSSQSPYLSVHAYGGRAHPTYTQSRKQRINAAGGGIMGSNAGSMLVAPTADGSRPGYGWIDDQWKKVKDTVADLIPNEIKDPIAKIIPNELKNPVVAAIALNQFGIPFTGEPGDRMGQNWMGDLIDQDLVLGKGGEQTGDLGLNILKPSTYGSILPEGMKKKTGEIIKGPDKKFGVSDILGIPQRIGGGIVDLIGKIPGGIGDVVGGIGDFLGPSDIGGREINWKTPLAIGLGAGAIQAAMPQSQLPQDTSGINIGDIRSRAKTGSDPGLHFLPPPEATTAYAQGGRTGFQRGGGPDWINTHEPGPMGNPAVVKEIENMREYKIANPDIEDVADYKGYYERLRRRKLQEMMERRPGILGAPWPGGRELLSEDIGDWEWGSPDLTEAEKKDANLLLKQLGLAKGGRAGYATGDRVQQDVIMSFSNYKSRGGKENFSNWFSDIYLPEAARQTTPEAVEGPEERMASLPPVDDFEIPKYYGIDRPSDLFSPWQEPAYRSTAFAAQGGRIGAQEGGLMDLGGMEKDYRQEGGFVPIGGEERADDVPARLSKNEFVFTADAVRSAGGGDIDAGAEVMENVMNNLERGGQISEESQGLEGARNMFATAQRLEGVM